MSTKRRKLIAGNWKMNCSRAEASQLASQIIASFEATADSELLICIPAIHLADVGPLLSDTEVRLGAQDGHWETSGAYTGEISSSMLKDYRVDYLLVGHSERRQLLADDQQRVAQKFESALKNGLKPILCIGETLEQREQGKTLQVLIAQCESVIERVGIQAFSEACVAYEPIWAIGTGKTASPEQAQNIHQALREFFASKDQSIATELQILYGGSMNAGNANELLTQPDIDGGLIGGASLKAEDFLQIYSAAG